MRIELYLNSEEYLPKGNVSSYLRYYQGQDSSYELLQRTQRFMELPKEIVKLRDMLESVAHRHGMDIAVYDRTRLRDTVRAFFKGVRRTPAVIIGRSRFAGDVTEEEIEKAIKSERRQI